MAAAPFYRSHADPGFDACNFSHRQHPVAVADARPSKAAFALDVHGFAYVDDPAGADPELLRLLRTRATDDIKQRYYAHVERLLKHHTGASKVIVFDHTLRRRDPALAGSNPDGREQPASYVHVDQGPVGAARRVYQHAGYDADALLKGRVQIINVWRPLNGPVKDWPLATMDSTTLDPANIHPTNLYRNRFELRGQSTNISHAPEQKWYYLDSQSNDEVTLIKIWDNKTSVLAHACAHCAFEHPDTPKDAPLRESMEVRCLVFHENEKPAPMLWWT